MSVWIIALVAFSVTVASQLVSRFVTNQSKIHNLRNEIKELSTKLKKLDPKSEEYQKIQNRILDINSELMKENFKSWPLTMAIFMLAFFLLGSFYTYENIHVGSVVNLEAFGRGTINSSCMNIAEEVNGTYKEQVKIGSNPCVINVNGKEFQLDFKSKPQEFKASSMDVKITPKKRTFINLPFSLPIIGNKIGWLGTYILFSLIASVLVTRIFDKFKVGKW